MVNIFTKSGGIIFILLLVPGIFSQDLTLTQYGYGNQPNEVIFSVTSSGDEPISNLTVYVDGEEYEKIHAYLEPDRSVMAKIKLEPGGHLIEVVSLEGARDSQDIFVSPIEHSPTYTEEIPLHQTSIFKFFLGFVITLMVFAWILVKKPKLDFS